MTPPPPTPLRAVAAAGSRHDTWQRHARLWELVTSPLRPAPEDVAGYRSAVEAWKRATGREDPVILLLGVTPEICEIPLGAEARVIAVDRSADMLAAVWPGSRRPGDLGLRADWRAMPLGARSVDIVIGDGALCPLRYPGDHAVLCAELHPLLRDGGRWLLRCFAAPEDRESVDDVFADLDGGRIGNVHVLKWRLAMALQDSPVEGVRGARVWAALHAAWPDLDLLADRFGWPHEQVRSLDAYRGLEARYTYPTLAEHRALLAGGGFEVMEIATSGYELGERCPLLVLIPRREAAAGSTARRA